MIQSPGVPFHARAARLLALILAALALAACVKQPLPEPPDDSAEQRVWHAFRANGGQELPPAFNLKAALNYSGPKDKHRIVIRFWGSPDLPLRMDLQAGIGATFAYWLEDENGFTALVPDDNAAYLHTDSRLGMAAFGFSFPYSMRELALLLNGQVRDLIPETYDSVRFVEGKGYEYAISRDDGQYLLTLDMEGRPVEILTPGEQPWLLEIRGYLEDQGFPRVPERIRMTHPPSEKAILYVKDIEHRDTPYPRESMSLEIPPGIELRRLTNE